jgi:hypothetical protein
MTMYCATALVMSVAAQGFRATPNPVSDFLRDTVVQSSRNLEGSAELMPPDRYAFRPTDAQMTFGELIAHVTQTNVALCSAASTTPSPMSPEQLQQISGKDAKADLVRRLKQSFDYCRGAFASSSDSQLGSETSIFGRATGRSRAATLITLAMDWADHY